MEAVKSNRVISIDILRGIVMVIMALDHTRDFFSNYFNNPTDLTQASTPMFLTRWITHFCAPVFVFLAGTSAWLSLKKGKTKQEASLFLLTRGIWLIILEFTIVRFGWQFNMDLNMLLVQVIWVIGCSMIFLSALIFLPLPLILTISMVLIFGHNMLDSIKAASFGANALWWNIVHEFGFVQLGNNKVFVVIYPLIPWIGVMAAGYCFGYIVQKPAAERNRWLYGIGFSAIALFIVLRAADIYGDPRHWSVQGKWWRTILSFINCEKYPPSLLYLLMTIGPAITLMPLLEKATNAAGRFFTVFGRVPMFYYIMHIYLLHSMAIIVAWLNDVPLHYFLEADTLFAPKPGWGYSLPGVYGWWILAVFILYFPCRWYMAIKMEKKSRLLSYI
jgi:uncharacterized membrane protein